MSWRDRARAAISAASGDIDPGLALAYQAGAEAERSAWQEATGADNTDEYVEPAQAKPHPALAILRANAQYSGQWIYHDGELRFVRGYPNGRYGYLAQDGEFVDVDGS